MPANVYLQMRGQLVVDTAENKVTFAPDSGGEFQLPLSPDDVHTAIELTNDGKRIQTLRSDDAKRS